MGLIKYILNIVFYPIIYIMALAIALYSAFGEGHEVNALDAINDAKSTADGMKDAVSPDEPEVTTTESSTEPDKS